MIETFISKISKQVSQDDKIEINSILDSISTIEDKEHYQSGKLRELFFYWGKYMPQHKQHIQCGSCRQAVLQFWQKIQLEWKNNG